MLYFIFVLNLAHSEMTFKTEFAAKAMDRVFNGCFSCAQKPTNNGKIEFQLTQNYLAKTKWGTKNGYFESLKILPSLKASDELCVDPSDQKLIGINLTVEPGKKTFKLNFKVKVGLYLPIRGQTQLERIEREHDVSLSFGQTLLIEIPYILRSLKIDSDRLEKVCSKSVVNQYLRTSVDKTVFVIALAPVSIDGSANKTEMLKQKTRFKIVK